LAGKGKAERAAGYKTVIVFGATAPTAPYAAKLAQTRYLVAYWQARRYHTMKQTEKRIKHDLNSKRTAGLR